MSAVAPGWYTDADDPALIRWWDGDAWTDHTQPNPATPPAADASSFPPPVSAAPPAPEPAPAASTPAPAPSAPVPPPFAEQPSPDLVVPPAADAVPSRRDSRTSGSPSIPVSAPVKLVPPTSSSFPISEPVRLVPPTAPVAEAPSGWAGAEPPAPSWAGAEPPSPSWSGAEPSRPTDSGSFAVTPLATVPPAPASAGTPWTSSSTFAQPTDSVDLASVDYEPMVRTWGSARVGTPGRTVTGVTTGGAWMLAITPLLALGLLALGWVLTDGGTSSLTTVIGSSLGAALVAWVLIATIADFRRLGALGHEFRPSVAWILVGPLLYLIARSIHVVRTSGRGAGPAWVYVVLSLVVGAALGAASVVLPREAGLAELRQVETQIVTELRQQGLEVSVLCPTEATLSVGSTFVCTAYDELGPVALLRVTYGGVPGSFTFEVESSSAGA